MFRQRNQTFNRFIKTSEPKFRKLISKQTTTEFQKLNTTHHNFPQLNQNNALDNSKENLLYEKHLIKVRSACKLDETTIVSKYLNSIRKNYDDMSKVGKRQLVSMNLKKRQIELIKHNNKNLVQRRISIEKKIVEKQKQTEQIKQKQQDAKMQKKTLEQIISRMKKDQLFYRQYGRIKDEQMKKREKQSKYLDEDIITYDEKVYKVMTIYEGVKKTYDNNKQLREKKFEDFSLKIDDVIERDKFIQERKDRTYELRSIELNDTLDEKNIHMRQIILAHKVADSLLESKVNSLLKKYSDIQAAFNVVKIKTCVSQPKLLTSKFFSYEQAAENLLQIIRAHQLKIQELIFKKQYLSTQYKELINENLSNFDKEKHHKNGEHDNKKEDIIEQINHKTLLINQIHTLVNKKIQQLGLNNPKDNSIEHKMTILSQFVLDSLQKHQKNTLLIGNKTATMGVRLKKLVKQWTTDEISLQIKERQQMKESNLIEDDFLNTQRQNMLKKGFSIKHIRKESSLANK